MVEWGLSIPERTEKEYNMKGIGWIFTQMESSFKTSPYFFLRIYNILGRSQSHEGVIIEEKIPKN